MKISLDEKKKFMQAKQFIKRKDYSRARHILLSIDHPKATEWYHKVNKIDPNYEDNARFFNLPITIIVFICGGIWLYFMIMGSKLAAMLFLILGLVLISLISKLRRY